MGRNIYLTSCTSTLLADKKSNIQIKWYVRVTTAAIVLLKKWWSKPRRLKSHCCILVLGFNILCSIYFPSFYLTKIQNFVSISIIFAASCFIFNGNRSISWRKNWEIVKCSGNYYFFLSWIEFFDGICLHIPLNSEFIS